MGRKIALFGFVQYKCTDYGNSTEKSKKKNNEPVTTQMPTLNIPLSNKYEVLFIYLPLFVSLTPVLYVTFLLYLYLKKGI